MKLASLKSKTSRDGDPLIVSRCGQWGVKISSIVPCLREAIENWPHVRSDLENIYNALNLEVSKEALTESKFNSNTLSKLSFDELQKLVKNKIAIQTDELHSPLPRSFQWCDGSAFLHHVRLVRKARGAELPATLLTTPLMYQGGSDSFLAPTEDIPQVDFKHGTDFEGEVAVITNDVPMGVSAEKALEHILLVLLVNDISLRGLIPEELAQGFGFLQSKPSSAFSPFALTLDELEGYWREGRLHLPLRVQFNGEFFGQAHAGEMHFHFGQLIAHAARTRDLAAGTIIGSGTVSNENPHVGSSCLVEKRMIEQIESGTSKTSYMKSGDTIEIWMQTPEGHDLFGHIRQKVKTV